jgi:hypothetical protein
VREVRRKIHDTLAVYTDSFENRSPFAGSCNNHHVSFVDIYYIPVVADKIEVDRIGLGTSERAANTSRMSGI